MPKLRQRGFQPGADGAQEVERSDLAGRGVALPHRAQVAGHRAGLDRVDGGFLQRVGVAAQRLDAVQLAALAQRAGPGEQRRDRVGGGLLAFQVLVVMAGHGAVGGLVFIVAVRRDEHRGHHGQRAEGGRDHVAHHVAVIVLARPDEPAFGADHAGDGVVDEGVEIFDAKGLELVFVLGVVNLLEDIFERVVVFFGDGVLGGEPQVLFGVHRILEAGPRKRGDGAVLVELALQHAGAVKLVDGLAVHRAVGRREHKLRLARAGHAVLRRAVDIAKGVAGDGDGGLPGAHDRPDAAHHDRRAENRAVQNGADGAVGALPHLGKVVFLHALGVGGDGGALDGHAVLFVGVGGVDGHLVFGFLAVDKAEVIVFGLEVHKRQDDFVLDLLPQDAGHLVAVHLDKGGGHFDLFHGIPHFLPQPAQRPARGRHVRPVVCGLLHGLIIPRAGKDGKRGRKLAGRQAGRSEAAGFPAASLRVRRGEGTPPYGRPEGYGYPVWSGVCHGL